jgi:PAS domain S-box-containing protein
VDLHADANFPRAPSAARAGLRTAVCFPIRGATDVLGAIEFLASERREPDHDLVATMTSLGSRIGQCVERWRGEERLRESDARKTAMLDAAFDCIITMDADGRVVEVNRATEQTFGYTAAEMVGRELAELIIPPALREAHRQGVARYATTGEAKFLGHPVELPAMRADGTEFPVEIAITQPQVQGQTQFTGYVRDVTERKRDEEALRSLAEKQAALRRVAMAVASEADQDRVFTVVTEQVGRLLGANSSNTLRFEPDGAGVVVGAWSTGGVRSVPVGTHEALDGPTVGAQILRGGCPARVDSFEGMEGETAELLRGLGFRSAVGAPINLSGRLWGAVIVSSVEESAFPAGAEQRVADFAELVALALANAEAREEVAASRARIVEAGDAERRRIERNLHDGAQQRLVALSLIMRLAERKLPGGSSEARQLLEQANAELADALKELRELARGIHPAILTDRGLGPALEMLAGRASIPVELCTELDAPLPRAVEAAAYYIVAEALTNTSKYACASRVRVSVTRANGTAAVDVADDGLGGADPPRGSGLRGLADRIEALGGTLELESPPGAGTTLRARIPCP